MANLWKWGIPTGRRSIKESNSQNTILTSDLLLDWLCWVNPPLQWTYILMLHNCYNALLNIIYKLLLHIFH